MHRLMIAALAVSALPAYGQLMREVPFSRAFGFGPLPAFDKGYLIFVTGNPGAGRVSVYRPDGTHAFDVTPRAPSGSRSIMSVAVASDGTLAVSVGYAAQDTGYGAAIVLFDQSGNQTRFVETGRYMPTQICFSEDDQLWSAGWQRDAAGSGKEDSQDYMLVRKYSKEGRELAAYLPRSAFGTQHSPFSPSTGLWTIRAAKDRIGAFVDATSQWVEFDLEGNLIGRWNVSRPDAGFAFTSSGRLYGQVFDAGRKAPQVNVFDREQSRWVPLPGAYPAPEPMSWGLLLGADGDSLVFARRGGMNLGWFRAE